ncbi:ankyrin [Neocallimastix sp. 'constans']
MDNENIEILKNSINNINKNNSKKIDTLLEIYKKGFLTSEKLNFIIKNYSDTPYISSSLLKKLIKDNETQLLNIIFDNSKFYDNEFIKTLLFLYKYKTSISVTDLNRIMSNNQYIITTNYSEENFQDYFESHSGNTPLFYACKSGNENLVKYLVKLGADVKKINHEKETPLFMACNSGNENLVKYLVELEVDITIESTRGETALFNACKSKNEKIVKLLIEHGADTNKENEWAETPLFFACKNGNEKMIEYLVEQGADINKVIDIINSPRRLFPYKNLNENIKKYLVELKANINKDHKI